MYCLLEVVSVCPEKLAPIFVEKIDWIKVSKYLLDSLLPLVVLYKALLGMDPLPYGVSTII